jgi:hypothetical protein
MAEEPQNVDSADSRSPQPAPHPGVRRRALYAVSSVANIRAQCLARLTVELKGAPCLWICGNPTILCFSVSSIGKATGCTLDGRGFVFLFPAGARDSSLFHVVQIRPGAHPSSYEMVVEDSFPWGKAAGA